MTRTGREVVAAKLEERRRREQEKRIRIIRQYSEIVNEMPDAVKEVLSSRMGSVEISAQSSFIAHFKYAIPKYDVETFRIKFIELFSTIGERILNRTIHQKRKRDGMANGKFWKEFEILFEEVPNAYGKKKGIKYKIRMITKTFSKIIRHIRKITFWF